MTSQAITVQLNRLNFFYQKNIPKPRRLQAVTFLINKLRYCCVSAESLLAALKKTEVKDVSELELIHDALFSIINARSIADRVEVVLGIDGNPVYPLINIRLNMFWIVTEASVNRYRKNETISPMVDWIVRHGLGVDYKSIDNLKLINDLDLVHTLNLAIKN